MAHRTFNVGEFGLTSDNETDPIHSRACRVAAVDANDHEVGVVSVDFDTCDAWGLRPGDLQSEPGGYYLVLGADVPNEGRLVYLAVSGGAAWLR